MSGRHGRFIRRLAALREGMPLGMGQSTEKHPVNSGPLESLALSGFQRFDGFWLTQLRRRCAIELAVDQ